MFYENKGQVGIGMGATMLNGTYWPRPIGKNILEIGIGAGELIQGACKDNTVYGVDICVESLKNAREKGFEKDAILLVLDICKDRLPFPDDWFDLAYCTEAMEHMSSPQFCIEQVKRTLIPDGYFAVTVPNNNPNYGYNCGNHSWIYPYLGDGIAFVELFMRSWFVCVKFAKNGGSNIFVFKNIKTGDISEVDPYTVTAGNYDFKVLYDKVINHPEAEKDIYDSIVKKATQFDH